MIGNRKTLIEGETMSDDELVTNGRFFSKNNNNSADFVNISLTVGQT